VLYLGSSPGVFVVAGTLDKDAVHVEEWAEIDGAVCLFHFGRHY
jgi:hypothetical protein